MVKCSAAPLLKRIKTWQLVCLGVSGWLTLYSAAMINWSGWRLMVGNTQGGCFATIMTLAGVEVRRFKRYSLKEVRRQDWINTLTTAQINANLGQIIQRQEFRVECPSLAEMEAGFGVRAVNAGRTVVFETEHWRKPGIGLEHVMRTEENRRKILANVAVIVGVGEPDEQVNVFIKTHPIQLLLGDEFRNMMESKDNLPA